MNKFQSNYQYKDYVVCPPHFENDSVEHVNELFTQLIINNQIGPLTYWLNQYHLKQENIYTQITYPSLFILALDVCLQHDKPEVLDFLSSYPHGKFAKKVAWPEIEKEGWLISYTLSKNEDILLKALTHKYWVCLGDKEFSNIDTDMLHKVCSHFMKKNDIEGLKELKRAVSFADGEEKKTLKERLRDMPSTQKEKYELVGAYVSALEQKNMLNHTLSVPSQLTGLTRPSHKI